MIEEGAAVWFSLNVPNFTSCAYKQMAKHHVETAPEAANYRDALKFYHELVAIEPEAIKILRAIDPRLDNLTPGAIQQFIPGVSQDLAGRLCQRRQMR
jgi:hypothetical protein